jgi:2-methylcitrate dehydratase
MHRANVKAWSMKVSIVEEMAEFVTRSKYDDLSAEARVQLRIRTLDTLGCAIGALGADPVRRVRRFTGSWKREGPCTSIGGDTGAPDRAALINGALSRYLDFNDSYLAPGETCHPSDNFAAILAAAELADADGLTLLTALAVAYQVQCRMADEASVRHRGFDHTTHLAYSAAAGAARALGLDTECAANAIAMSGASLSALRVTRTGALSHWKGFAAPFTASAALDATLLAREGVTGPLGIFEGNKGLMDSITGYFTIHWEHEDLERITATILKRFNAEIHSQTAIQAALDLRGAHQLRARDIATVEVDVFDVAYHIIGGGDEGDKTVVMTKEDADHSLPYLIAVALVDGEVMPAQYDSAHIKSPELQDLLCRVSIRSSRPYSRRFPDEMVSAVTVTLVTGERFSVERSGYPGFRTDPMTWDDVRDKFFRLASPHSSQEHLSEIVRCVANLENIRTRDLTRLLARIPSPVERKLQQRDASTAEGYERFIVPPQANPLFHQ